MKKFDIEYFYPNNDLDIQKIKRLFSPREMSDICYELLPNMEELFFCNMNEYGSVMFKKYGK
jgi:hypothetical protein